MDDKLVRLSDVKALFHRGDEKTFPFSSPGFVIERDVDSIPAVDAVEVVHGRWEGDYPQATFRLKRCSVCETLAPEGWYCFFCGARMDGEDGET